MAKLDDFQEVSNLPTEFSEGFKISSNFTVFQPCFFVPIK